MVDINKVVFFNITWMRDYNGNWQTDKPVHGGSWIKDKKWGGEIYNFQPFNGQMLGYVETGFLSGKQRNINLSNFTLRPGGIKFKQKIPGVLVVWVATPKDGSEPLVVGWYKNATLYSKAQIPPKESGRALPEHDHPGEYFVSAAQEDCVLLPPEKRTLGIPGKGKGMGRSNIWYAQFKEGPATKNKVIQFIQGWENSVVEQDPVQYYLIGTYDSGKRDSTGSDTFPEMISKNVVSVGYAGDHDLSAYYGKPQSEIIAYLKSKNERPASCTCLKYFLNLKPGDRLAIKGKGTPKGHTPYLSIIAYAVVAERNGKVYEYDPEGQQHFVNVEYIEGVFLELPIGGFGRTIHHLTQLDQISNIFGYYDEIPSQGLTPRGTENKRPTGEQHRSGAAAYVVEQAHNKLQQAIIDYLRGIPGNVVTVEEGNVDIIVRSAAGTSYYEVKAYNTAKQCLREALGQIIEYSWFKNPAHNNLNLIIVGPRQASPSEKEYIDYINTNFHQQISYADFENHCLDGD